MYKVFFNDRIVFVGAGFNKSLIQGALTGKIQQTRDVKVLWLQFLNDPGARHLHLTGGEDVWAVFRSFFNMIEAAGGLVYNEHNALLCIQRFGKWDLPKGKIEAGETRSDAALREVEEETGLSGLVLERFLTTTYHIYAHPRKENRWVLKPTYWYKMQYKGSDLPVPQTSEGIEKVEWIHPSASSQMIANTYASLVEVFQLSF